MNRRPDMISPPLFHTARTLSGSLRSPPSPRGEGFVSKIPLPSSNLRPFGAHPSIGRRECPREPLPLEGARGTARRGWLPFFGGARVLSYIVDLRRSSPLSFIPPEPYPARSARHLPHAGKALSVVILFPHMRVFALTMREKRYPRIAAFPIGEGGPRSGG